MKHRSRWLAAIAAVPLALVVTASAFGYAGEVASSVTVARAGAIKCNVNISVTATVVDAAGKAIAGQPVAWSWVTRVSSRDKIRSISTTTNANGVATVKVFLACVAGNRQIRATADGVNGGAVLGLTAVGLPATNTLPSMPQPAGSTLYGTLLAFLALAAGALVVARRLALRSR